VSKKPELYSSGKRTSAAATTRKGLPRSPSKRGVYFDPDVPVEGYYRTRLGKGAVDSVIEIWRGPPIDPEDGEPMLDRPLAWQAKVNGTPVPVTSVWPGCGRDPISKEEHDRLCERNRTMDASLALSTTRVKPYRYRLRAAAVLICSIEGCDGKAVGRGYCDKHYRRLLRRGSLELQPPRIAKACEVEGCERPIYKAAAYCRPHRRAAEQYGDPLARKRSEKGAGAALLLSLVGTDNDDCVLWPFGGYLNGYGYVYFKGKLTGAHRASCWLKFGAPPTSDHQAAHSCGQKRCVNPRHLRWATQRENEADKPTEVRRRVTRIAREARWRRSGD
jgi:hypothetical protein